MKPKLSFTLMLGLLVWSQITSTNGQYKQAFHNRLGNYYYPQTALTSYNPYPYVRINTPLPEAQSNFIPNIQNLFLNRCSPSKLLPPPPLPDSEIDINTLSKYLGVSLTSHGNRMSNHKSLHGIGKMALAKDAASLGIPLSRRSKKFKKSHEYFSEENKEDAYIAPPVQEVSKYSKEGKIETEKNQNSEGMYDKESNYSKENQELSSIDNKGANVKLNETIKDLKLSTKVKVQTVLDRAVKSKKSYRSQIKYSKEKEVAAVVTTHKTSKNSKVGKVEKEEARNAKKAEPDENASIDSKKGQELFSKNKKEASYILINIALNNTSKNLTEGKQIKKTTGNLAQSDDKALKISKENREFSPKENEVDTNLSYVDRISKDMKVSKEEKEERKHTEGSDEEKLKQSKGSHEFSSAENKEASNLTSHVGEPLNDSKVGNDEKEDSSNVAESDDKVSKKSKERQEYFSKEKKEVANVFSLMTELSKDLKVGKNEKEEESNVKESDDKTSKKSKEGQEFYSKEVKEVDSNLKLHVDRIKKDLKEIKEAKEAHKHTELSNDEEFKKSEKNHESFSSEKIEFPNVTSPASEPSNDSKVGKDEKEESKNTEVFDTEKYKKSKISHEVFSTVNNETSHVTSHVGGLLNDSKVGTDDKEYSNNVAESDDKVLHKSKEGQESSSKENKEPSHVASLIDELSKDLKEAASLVDELSKDLKVGKDGKIETGIVTLSKYKSSKKAKDDQEFSKEN